MREIDSTCRQDLFVKNKLCSSTQMFIKFKLLSGKRVYVFANLFVWASSGGKFAKCDGIWIFGNGFFDKPKSISIGSGYQFWQSRFPSRQAWGLLVYIHIQDTLLKDWQSSLAPSHPIRILFICCVYFTLIMKL